MRTIKSLPYTKLVLIITALSLALVSCVGRSPREVVVASQGQDWIEEFDLSNRNLTDAGESKYFVLVPGFQTVLTSQSSKLVITVLDETREINGILTRVIEEREEKNGELAEISRNYFAIDQDTGDAFYFGEDVDFYSNGEITGHSGTWLAYQGGNKPGLIMPGNPAAGMKYYQELAPGKAMDRAEVLKVSETYKTPAGEFKDCLVTEESSRIEPLTIEYKTYAPGIGLIQDQSLLLVSYGYVEVSISQE